MWRSRSQLPISKLNLLARDYLEKEPVPNRVFTERSNFQADNPLYLVLREQMVGSRLSLCIVKGGYYDGACVIVGRA